MAISHAVRSADGDRYFNEGTQRILTDTPKLRRLAAKTHHLPAEKVHFKWDNSLEPALEIEPGDSVVFDLQEVSNGQIKPSSKAEALLTLNWDNTYPLGGPIYVKNAKPGDALEVDILELKPKGWGWTGFFPKFGLLPEDFDYAYIKHWDLRDGISSKLKAGVTVPLDPFCGTMGVAPKERGSFHPLPPGDFGGNMDIRHLTAGTKSFFPVWNEGGLFSCGDCHSAQGDGEVCVTGIESPMRVKLRFNVRKGMSIPSPQFITRGPLTRRYDAEDTT